MAVSSPDPHRQQELYWDELVELKVRAIAIRRHRNYLDRWNTRINFVKAIASSASIAAWAIWQKYPLMWGAIIALSQVIEATKDVFPFSRRLKAAGELTVVLERLFIDAQFEWESVYSGRLDTSQVTEAWRHLQVAQLEAESNAFPSGFELSAREMDLAKGSARAYFHARYHV
jgi:hypothetical protein